MIVDSIQHVRDYASVLPHLEAGLAAMGDGSGLAVGRHEFEGGFLLVQEGETSPLEEGTFEAHRKFIDVQFVLEGAEEIAWQEYGDLTCAIPYDEASDKERLDGSRAHHLLVTAGMFWAAFPHDGHKAISHVDERHHYRKVVMKLPVR